MATTCDVSEERLADRPDVREDSSARPRILTRALALVFVANFGGLTGFYLLLSVVPLYATSLGAGRAGAGLVTGVLMFATVAAEFVTPRLLARFGSRLMFAAGLLLLGMPALALIATDAMAAILAVCALRGVGLAITVIVGGALVASLVPPERRGEGLGISGVVVLVPSIVALPLGVWLVGHAGYPAVFVAGASAALAGLVVVPRLPDLAGSVAGPDVSESADPRVGPVDQQVGILAGLRQPALVRPAIAFSVTAMAAGIVVAYLPLAVGRDVGSLVPLALFLQAASATVVRWWAGRLGDRYGPARLLLPAVLAAAAGMLAVALTTSPAAVVVGMVLFGAGFGAAQNASLSGMLERVSQSGYGMVTAMWNMAYDAALGLGAAGFGVLATRTGYSVAFVLTATLMLGALVPAWREFGLRSG